MFIGICTVDLIVQNSCSLKEKRMVLKSIADRLKNRYNISIASIDGEDKWQYASLGIAHVNTDKKMANSILSKIVNFIENYSSVELIKYNIQII